MYARPSIFESQTCPCCSVGNVLTVVFLFYLFYGPTTTITIIIRFFKKWELREHSIFSLNCFRMHKNYSKCTVKSCIYNLTSNQSHINVLQKAKPLKGTYKKKLTLHCSSKLRAWWFHQQLAEGLLHHKTYSSTGSVNDQ